MKTKYWKRRDLLKTIGTAAFGAAISQPAWSGNQESMVLDLKKDPRYKKPGKPLTAIILGAGGRGHVYAAYAEKYPDELNIIGVAEPIPFRRERIAERFKINRKYQWVTWEHALDIPKFADVAIITMPDHLHYRPALQAMEVGYDLLLEKAMAQTWQQCVDIYKQSKKHDRIVAICHVLRYTSYFRKMKEVIESGVLGDIVSVQHLEPVEHIHMSHSFVRGNWRNSKESTPMIISKSCHDTDILRWVIGKSCKRVTSFGSLKHFREDAAPTGSTARCSDGCAAESSCPYSALRIYLENKTWLWHLAIPDNEDGTILQALKNGPYGKCVYRSDNDVVDHQVMNMEFDEEITVAFSMEALTSYGGRRTRIFGTKGDLAGDMNELVISDFLSGKEEKWDASKHIEFKSAHGGGDHGLVHDFIQAVIQHDESLLTSNIEASMESHLMGFMAEESRLNNGEVLAVNLDLE
ncbi:Gfo/Idh/MocA family protein [Bacteroidota bacterium]